MSKRKHSYSLLYAHYGPYGPQDVHYHPCVAEHADDEGCPLVIEGKGRHCKGVRKPDHKRVDLEKRLKRKKIGT